MRPHALPIVLSSLAGLFACTQPEALVRPASVCQIVRNSDAAWVGRVVSWEAPRVMDLSGYKPPYEFAPVTVDVEQIRYGTGETGRVQILFPGKMEVDRHASGRLQIDGTPTRGHLYVRTVDGRYVLASQGYFWEEDDGLHNAAKYLDTPISEAELLERERAARAAESCPGDEYLDP
ncbi:MAG: hypothetical protein D6729_05810 [Deltaproteobacteria bacterium]|nr:MAG: hypothetical protein D6729_05810 [Deltaproteobacteria bacterium]